MGRILLGAMLGLGAGLVAGCGGDSDGLSAGADSAQAFDLSDLGMRGMVWTGEAELLAPGLRFEETDVSINRINFSLTTEHRDMSEFTNPPLEFRNQPVDMALSIRGPIEEHEPGSVTVSIESVRARFTGGLGTSSEEAMLEDLAANGIELPQVSGNDPIRVTLQIVASGDEDEYEEIRISSDADFIQRLDLREGERAPL